MAPTDFKMFTFFCGTPSLQSHFWRTWRNARHCECKCLNKEKHNNHQICTLMETHTWSHFCQTQTHKPKPPADILNRHETYIGHLNAACERGGVQSAGDFSSIRGRGVADESRQAPGPEGWHARSSGASGIHPSLAAFRRTLCCCCCCCCVYVSVYSLSVLSFQIQLDWVVKRGQGSVFGQIMVNLV